LCSKDLGNKRFSQMLLNNHKHHDITRIVCLLCADEALKKERTLHSEFRKSSVYCKCFCPIHRELCPLSPRYANEKRWPGCDGHIDSTDRKFMDALVPRPAWWAKAWGKKKQ
jgi:hypothetical protein